MTHWRMLGDDDLGFLEEITEVIDQRLDRIGEEIEQSPDPDGWGLLDRFEHATGLGFVACQTYLTTIVGPKEKGSKGWALDLGPRHASGYTMAAITNAGANYWKHRAEWRRDHPPSGGYAVIGAHKLTADILEAIGVWRRETREDAGKYDYPLSNLIFAMLAPEAPRFAAVVPYLQRWRDEVLAPGGDRRG